MKKKVPTTKKKTTRRVLVDEDDAAVFDGPSGSKAKVPAKKKQISSTPRYKPGTPASSAPHKNWGTFTIPKMKTAMKKPKFSLPETLEEHRHKQLEDGSVEGDTSDDGVIRKRKLFKKLNLNVSFIFLQINLFLHIFQHREFQFLNFPCPELMELLTKNRRLLAFCEALFRPPVFVLLLLSKNHRLLPKNHCVALIRPPVPVRFQNRRNTMFKAARLKVNSYFLNSSFLLLQMNIFI